MKLCVLRFETRKAQRTFPYDGDELYCLERMFMMVKMGQFLRLFGFIAAAFALCVFGSSPAQAMTISDLQGDYRIVGQTYTWGANAGSMVFNLHMVDGELVGTIKQLNGSKSFDNVDVGRTIMEGFYVDEGTLYCQWTYGPGCTWLSKVNVYNNGAEFKVSRADAPSDFYWKVKRIS